MKILIIGASGLVGGNCLDYLGKYPNKEVVGTHLNFEGEHTVYFNTLDLDNANNFDVKTFAPDVVMHCGALTHVDYCEDNIDESYEKTVRSTANVIKLCTDLKAKMIFVSTDYIYDGKAGPYSEDAEVNPLNVYGKHKLEAEKLVKGYANHLILRVTNVYGLELRNKNFVGRIIQNVKNGEKLKLQLPYDQFATPLNARDVARATRRLIDDNKTGDYNLGSTDIMNRVQLAEKVLSYLPTAEYSITPISTAELGQAALRPLKAGLHASKFLSEYPDFEFRNVDHFMKFVTDAE